MMRIGFAVGLVLVVACGGGARSGGGGGLAGAQPSLEQLRAVPVWQVVQLPGVAVLPATNRPTMRFGEDGRIAGSTGCNQYGGPFERTEESFTFGEIVATRMACEGRMEVEAVFLQALRDTRTVGLDAQVLSLLGEDGRLLARMVAGEAGGGT